MDDKDNDLLVEDAVAKQDLCGQISRKQAITAGNLDEICPLCSGVFLAHVTDPIVRGCKQSPCHYDPPTRA